MNDSSVTRTASDALQAKASAVVNAGYRPVVPAGKAYESLLEKMAPSPKRQTPLVHAGYVLRCQAILSAVHRFIDYIDAKHGKAQIVVLGGGLDVTGLWAGQLIPTRVLSVVEVDLPAVCTAKRQILQKEGIIVFEENEETESAPECMFHRHTGSFANDKSTKFTLVQADLRNDEAALNDSLQGIWDAKCPTLVLSEVVLAYIDSESTNRILSWWAKALQHPDSCFFLLEPLGGQSCDDDADTGTRMMSGSILQNYQRTYTRMLQTKMDRGTKGEQHNSFSPMGATPHEVAKRLHRAGWVSARAVSLADATSSTRLQANELFDEHAALLLHAQSYVVACAWSCVSTSALFRRVMAPWHHPIEPFRPNTDLWIATIDPTEEDVVRKMFVDGYEYLSCTNKSVQKLVDAALKKDLAVRKPKPDDQDNPSISHFAKYYEDQKGCFLVAMDSTTHEILGFVALCKSVSQNTNGIYPKSPYTFEIHRLFVSKAYRSRGVAGHLMDSVERVAMSWVPDRSTGTFVVTTLDVLEAAKKFYEKRGYALHDEVPLVGVTLHQYVAYKAKPKGEDA